MPCAVLLALALSIAGATTAAGAPPGDIDAIRAAKRIDAAQIDQPIQIDGVLDEPAWELATPTTDFYQQQPAEFELATRRTEVRFLYDEEMLYVGAVLYDPDPERLITNELKRDFGGSSGDGLGLILDTFQDRRSSYGFITNPGGAQRDSLGYDNGRRNDANWHGVWFVRTAIRPDGWSLEYAIPFKTLRFPEGVSQQWGMNMVRWARRANETSTWAPVPRQFSHYNVAYAGVLAGIENVEPGRNLHVKPFATSDVSDGLEGSAAWSGGMDGGFDLKWGITSSLTLDGTYRMDFSQVEADEQQINLTRFSLFFRHDLGFVRRAGIGTLFGNYTRVFRPSDSSARIREHTLGGDYEATADDRLTHWLTRVGGLSYGTLFDDGAELRVFAIATHERLETPFRIGPALVVPPGVYDFDQGGVRYETNPSAVVSGSVELGGGEFWTGRQRSAAASIRYRFSAHLATSASLSRTNVDLPDGTFIADLVGLRVDWSATPRMFLNAFVQYNGETDTWLSNVRYNLIHRPLSDVYVVWNETRSPGLTTRALLLKYTHLIAF